MAATSFTANATSPRCSFSASMYAKMLVNCAVCCILCCRKAGASVCLQRSLLCNQHPDCDQEVDEQPQVCAIVLNATKLQTAAGGTNNGSSSTSIVYIIIAIAVGAVLFALMIFVCYCIGSRVRASSKRRQLSNPIPMQQVCIL